jgi:acyl dehydratase
VPPEGSRLEPWIVESVSAEAMRVIADVLRDPNPIHLDPAAVRAAGLGDRVINQGPANGSYIANMLRANFPGARVRALRLRLRANVFAGDRVVAGGTVEAREGDLVHCRVWLDVDGRGRAIEGTAVVALRPIAS